MTDELKHIDDEFYEQSLGQLDADAAPPDAASIAESVAFAGEVFRNGKTAEPKLILVSSASEKSISARGGGDTKGNGTMFVLAKPLAALASAIALLVVAWLSPDGATADITLGRILDQTLEADSLQLEVIQGDERADVLIAGDSIRWQDSPQQYRIASGNRLWKIDETENTVRDEANPWLTEEAGRIDLLALLGGSSSGRLRSLQPSGQTEHAGVLCNVFVYRPPGTSTQLTVQAFADAESNQLYTIGCWPAGVDYRVAPPIAELRMVKRNIAYDESKFVIGNSLSTDGRIGTVREVQGTILMRPRTSQRWTLVTDPAMLKSGDWIRAEIRGANAASVIMTSGFRLILGPGSLLELTSARTATLHHGEVNVTGSASAVQPFRVSATAGQAATVSPRKRLHLTIDDHLKLVRLAKKPTWLAGFDGSSTGESMGSLVTKIDGREIPLTIGFHKVNVEIRDQIARTTIEESFVNHTKSRLEGVFHFPLPQDASISGFGMWINGELIEADVVEKQRAREIYETILRERRDPGLLEWAGGNIFKARVFPIEPHSEKRIKIVYTQVLPMRSNSYRYSYGLRSEMLQKTPLRELSLNVLVNSALPLKEVRCPTHSVRSDLTAHSASIEFSAQEYTPTRDFEVVCEVDARESDVVVVPHQRGEDGYFLAQITPPGPVGQWQRNVLPDGTPLNLLVVCDTSGSMNADIRKTQSDFVASLLTSLSKEDTFNVAYCDVGTGWLHTSDLPASTEQVQAAVRWISKRRSLGWTDLDHMLSAVSDRISRSEEETQPNASGNKAQTHVIYVGDGIVTAGDADPQAFARRVARLTSEEHGATFHAISVGSSFESGVLKSIAAVGGGSVRHIDGEQTPQRTAAELLNELAQPGLHDLQVEFNGLQVAAVYPGDLPNLAMGTQQILVGRYLPSGDDQSGEIVITGTRNGESVRYVSRIQLKDAERGNSFIPRLWARAHLDHLLQQGNNETIQDQIIALSEEFHIMTPYTSLLVLETDEDRERFGVKRRFLMRDGEQFFADGRSGARFELLQQQMKAAGNWRLNMRHRILAQLATLGRDPQLFEMRQQFEYAGRVSGMGGSGYVGGGGGFGVGGFGSDNMQLDISGELGAVDKLISVDEDAGFEECNSPFSVNGADTNGVSGTLFDRQSESLLKEKQEVSALQMPDLLDAEHPADQPGGFRQQNQHSLDADGLFDLRSSAAKRQLFSANGGIFTGSMSRPFALNQPDAFSRSWVNGHYTAWVSELFPALPATTPSIEPVRSLWPEEPRAVADSLIQPLVLKPHSGFEIQLNSEYRNARWNIVTQQISERQLFSAERWLTVVDAPDSHSLLNWCDDKHRGIVSRAYKLGRQRQADKADLKSFNPGNRPWAVTSLADTYAKWDVNLQRTDGNRAVLNIISPSEDSAQTITAMVDTQRKVLLSFRVVTNGTQSSETRYSRYVKAGSVWWPQTVEVFDDKGRLTSRVTQTVKELNDTQFSAKFESGLPETDVLLIKEPLPELSTARIADDAATADFADYVVLLLDACYFQRWDDALDFLQKAETIASDYPGTVWVRQRILSAARQNNAARLLIAEILEKLAIQPQTSDLFLANSLFEQAQEIADQNELLQLLKVSFSVYDRQPEYLRATRTWKNHKANALNTLARTREALELYEELARSALWDISAQTTYAHYLSENGDVDEAITWLEQQIDSDAEYTDYESRSLRYLCAQILRSNTRMQQLIEFLADWVKTNPSDQAAYQQYLSALFVADRTQEANAVATQWLNLAGQPQEFAQGDLERLNAAVSFALGEVYQHHQSWMDPIWRKPLHTTALQLIERRDHLDVVSRILSHHRFNSTDEASAIRRIAAEKLHRNANDIPVERLSHYVSWAVQADMLSAEILSTIVRTLRNRWEMSHEQRDRRLTGDALLRIYEATSQTDKYLQFLRDRIAYANELDDPSIAASHTTILFQALLNQPWSEGNESEAFALLSATNASTESPSFLTTPLNNLHQLVDRMIAGRVAANVAALMADGHPEDLTRQQLAAKQSSFRLTARNALRDRLRQERDKLSGDYPTREGKLLADVLSAWMQIEHMHLEVMIADASNERFPADIAQECQSILSEAPPERAASDASPEADLLERESRVIERLRKERVFRMLCNLSLRRAAPKSLRNFVMSYIEKGLQFPDNDASFWKAQRIAMLISLDQPEVLEKSLREWIQTTDNPVPYQKMLSRLLAEQGEIDDAISLMESVQNRLPLTPSDLSTMADWYLVADRRDDYRATRVEAFKAADVWRIQDYIHQQQRAWSRTDLPLPSELNEGVIYAFQALFQKSNSPENYVYQLRQFYTASRDFRLMKMVPDAMTGQTPQNVYRLLSSLQSGLFTELRSEAAADELLQHLDEVRPTAESAIDRRALDLLEAVVERRAAEVLNQSGPHAAAAVAALQRAFTRDWADGEIVQMATFLAGMGTIRQESIADERLRQLKRLLNMTEAGTDEALRISWQVASALYNSHSRKQEALSVMESALRDYKQHNPAGLPNGMNNEFNGYLTLLQNEQRFAEAESRIKAELQEGVNKSQQVWLNQRLNECCYNAFRNKGEVSLGAGAALYRNLLNRLLQEAKTSDDNYRHSVFTSINNLFAAAREQQVDSYKDDLKKYAFRQFPDLRKHQISNYRDVVNATSSTISNLLGHREELRFLIVQAESYPARFENTWENAWQQFARRLADLRRNTKGISDLEPRLLKIVLKELRRDLVSGNQRHRAIMDKDYLDFWGAKEEDFARVANEVAKQHRESGKTLTHVANYLYHDLHHYDRALEILMDAWERKTLNLAQQITLVDLLHRRKRHAESIPVLRPIVKATPDQMAFRTQLIIAYAFSKRPSQRDKLLAETEKYFRSNRQWTEANAASLAQCCLTCKLYAKAAALYEEVISRHQRTAQNQGVGNGTLSEYYRQQASAYAGLGATAKAVDAAAGSVVSWGPRHSQRRSAIETLQQVIADAKDLDDYVRFLDKQAEESGTDSALIRRMAGTAYASRGEHLKAIPQLRIAIQLQPFDVESHALLTRSLDALEDKDGAIAQMLTQLDFDRHNLSLYRVVAERLADNAELSERAATSLVEAAPLEAEHHQALAEFRQVQGRWPEAITHWNHVVRLRSLEPAGLIKLAEAQLHEQRWQKAQQTIQKLSATEWPSRFSQVPGEVRRLMRMLPPASQL